MDLNVVTISWSSCSLLPVFFLVKNLWISDEWYAPEESYSEASWFWPHLHQNWVFHCFTLIPPDMVFGLGLSLSSGSLENRPWEKAYILLYWGLQSQGRKSKGKREVSPGGGWSKAKFCIWSQKKTLPVSWSPGCPWRSVVLWWLRQWKGGRKVGKRSLSAVSFLSPVSY